VAVAPSQNFYQQIGANRRRSLVLVFLVAALLALLGFMIGYGTTGSLSGGYVAIAIALIVASVLSIASYYGGSSLVLASAGAKEVTEAQAPQLMNVIRELAIAANIPMPRVYVIDDTAPNAFATGRDPKHASVAITTGLLEKLDREELQGVMGHELSHVRNYDIRFTLLVGVLVGSIALLADFFLRFTFWGGMSGRSSRRSSEGGGGGGLQIIVFVLAIVLAILAPFFANLVKLAVSRQREYLADASSVELTRNPYGLERALAKIATDTEVLEVANRATQHLYIVNPIKKFESRAAGLTSTHPPVLDRINRLRALTGEAPLDQVTSTALAGLD
jgi:heat shock protein HtpX